MKTSLKKIYEQAYCPSTFEDIAYALGKWININNSEQYREMRAGLRDDDEQVTLAKIFERAGFWYALRVLNAFDGHDEAMLDFADRCSAIVGRPPQRIQAVDFDDRHYRASTLTAKSAAEEALQHGKNAGEKAREHIYKACSAARDAFCKIIRTAMDEAGYAPPEEPRCCDKCLSEELERHEEYFAETNPLFDALLQGERLVLSALGGGESEAVHAAENATKERVKEEFFKLCSVGE